MWVSGSAWTQVCYSGNCQLVNAVTFNQLLVDTLTLIPGVDTDAVASYDDKACSIQSSYMISTTGLCECTELAKVSSETARANLSLARLVNFATE